MIAILVYSIFAAQPAAGVPAEVVDRFEAHEFEHAGKSYPYRLLKPATIEPGVKYPVVLFLHGAGERGDDNIAQLKFLPTWMSHADMRERYPCFLIAPQCPEEVAWSGVLRRGLSESRPMTAEPTDPMAAAIGILQHVLKTYPTDEDRVYLTGLSMGGYGTWDLASRHPDWFAAVGPICGGGDVNQAAKLASVPIWAWHGDADTAVPPIQSRLMIDAIDAAGGKPKYTELAGVAHNSWTAAYTRPDGLIPWLFEQKRR